jgi:hypothetical protein
MISLSSGDRTGIATYIETLKVQCAKAIITFELSLSEDGLTHQLTHLLRELLSDVNAAAYDGGLVVRSRIITVNYHRNIGASC